MTQVRALGPEDDLASMFLQVQPLPPGRESLEAGCLRAVPALPPRERVSSGTTCGRGERAPGPATRVEPWLPSLELGDPDKLPNLSCLSVLFCETRLRGAPTLGSVSRAGPRVPLLLPLSWGPGSSWHVPSPCPDHRKQAGGPASSLTATLHVASLCPHAGAFCSFVETDSRVVHFVRWRVGACRFSVRSAVQPSPLAEWRMFSSPPRKPGFRSMDPQSPWLAPRCFLPLCLASSLDTCVRGAP